MRLTCELVSTVLEAALYSHKQGKVSVWPEAEKYSGPQLSRFTKYLRPKPYTLQQNIPNYWECLFQFGVAQPFFTPGPAGNLDCETTLEWLWFRCQTFHTQCRQTRVLKLPMPDFLPLNFSKLISLFSRLCSGLENCFANFKTFSRIQDSAQTLCDAFFFYMSFCFCLEVFHFSVSFCFCFEVCGFAMRFLVLPWSICFCREERYLLLLWQLGTTVDKGVCSHRLLDSKLRSIQKSPLLNHPKLALPDCIYMESYVGTCTVQCKI